MKSFKQHLTELSKKTLGNYIKKSSSSRADNAVLQGAKMATLSGEKGREEDTKHNKIDRKRADGIARAVKQITNEDIVGDAVYNKLEPKIQQHMRRIYPVRSDELGLRAARKEQEHRDSYKDTFQKRGAVGVLWRLHKEKNMKPYNEEFAADPFGEETMYNDKLIPSIGDALAQVAAFDEAVEPIDELSKKTLGSYITKAARSTRASTSLGKDFERTANHHLAKAHNSEALAASGDTSYDHAGEAKHHRMGFEGNAHFEKEYKAQADRRVNGIARAAAKLTKEETELVDEAHVSFNRNRYRGVTKSGKSWSAPGDTENGSESSDFTSSHVLKHNPHLSHDEAREASRNTRNWTRKVSSGEVEDKKHIYEAYEGMEHLSDAAHELVLHADNNSHLHHGSHMPIINNLKKKAHKGVYDSEKAKKLWGYHADRAAQSYHKEYGDKSQPWHKMFTTHDRRQAAEHFEARHRDEVHEA